MPRHRPPHGRGRAARAPSPGLEPRRIDAMRQRVLDVARLRYRLAARRAAAEAADRVAPSSCHSAHRFGDVAIAHEHRVHRRAEEPLDEQRRRLIRADEIAQRAEHRAVAELFALAQAAARPPARDPRVPARARRARSPCLAAKYDTSSARNSSARAVVSRSRVSRSDRADAPRRRVVCSVHSQRCLDDGDGGALELAIDRRERVARAARARCASCSMRCDSSSLSCRRALAIDLRRVANDPAASR